MRKILFWLVCFVAPAVAEPRWSEQRAKTWYAEQPWLVGANYLPATAINQLEMWQPETFDPRRIDQELAWAEALGMNTMRVFLHDLLWQDPEGFSQRLNTFLNLCSQHKIRPTLVLFDSVWDPLPRPGRQRAPRPGVHNSGWVQSPGVPALRNPDEWPRLEAYVKGVVGTFQKDPRILAWDVWNEPDNTNDGSYKQTEARDKSQLVLALLPQVFAWAREANPTQPLTSGVWNGDWSSNARLKAMERTQLALSDVVSFHSYDPPAEFEKRLGWLTRYRRPILCTEYMARGRNSTFQGILPLCKRYRVGAYNWGLVAGKAQTHLPWDSWQKPYVNREPALWFHEVFRSDGRPYRPAEVEFIKRILAPQS